MNKEKVRELAYLLIGRDTGSVDSKCKIITEWFEQNPVEPVVVGLSDEQIIILGEVIRSRPNESETLVIRDWLKTQTFAQPNTLLEYQLDAARKEIKRVESLNADLLKSQQILPDLLESLIGLLDENMTEVEIAYWREKSIKAIAFANAKLIAAPDLLEALQLIFKHYDRNNGEAPHHCHGHKAHWDLDDSPCEVCSDWEKARAAINKATGEYDDN